MEQDVLQDIIDNSDFKFSRNGLSVRYNQMLKQYTNQAKMYGMTLSQMAQANGMDEAGFKEYIYSSVKEAAKKEIVVKDIAAKEGLDNLTDEDKGSICTGKWNQQRYTGKPLWRRYCK